MLRFLWLSVMLVCFSAPASAMSCKPPDNQVKSYPVIFKGVAEATRDLPQDIVFEDLPEAKNADHVVSDQEKKVYMDAWIGKPQVTTFKILEFYKGKEEKEFEIYHRSAPSLFGALFEIGQTYFIYANKDDNNKYATSTGFCSPSIALKDIKDKDKTYSQLKIYAAQQDAFTKLLKDEAENPYYLYEQGLFYEGYNDYYRAGEAYLNGLKASKNWPPAKGEAIIIDGNDNSLFNRHGGIPFTAAYGRMLFMQERYEEAMKPLGYAQDEESKRLQNATLIKLKAFPNLGHKAIDMKNMKVDSLDLTGATLDGLDLSGSTVGALILDDTTLDGANFDSATIRKLSITDSMVTNAIFARARINGFDIPSSKFPKADFSRAKLYFGNVHKADFNGANFYRADMTFYQTLTDSDFSNAQLSAADFSGSQLFVEVGKEKGKPVNTKFTDAHYDNDTKWFKEFDPLKAGAKKSPAK